MRRSTAFGRARAFIRLSLAICGIVTMASAARPELLPAPDQMVLPGEQALFNQLMAEITKSGVPDSKSMLGPLDDALVKLRAPTKLRGFVQFSRAGALIEQNRYAEALDAIEESIRLLPDYSGPLILAAWAYSYSDRPGTGADYLLRASDKDPEAVRSVDDYEINNMLRRLRNVRDERRIGAVSDRLLEIGWLGTGLGSRSNLAVESIKRKLAQGDVPGGRALVTKLLLPNHTRELLVDHAYRAIWPDLEQWAGPKLQRQWTIYLDEVRARWAASKSVETVADYTGALMMAGHDRTVVRDILPLFSPQLDKEKDYELLFVAGSAVAALAQQGRWDEIDLFYRRAEQQWPLGSDANALNIAANRAKWLLYRGSFKDALAKMDAAIADARKWGPQVNSDALGLMHYYRACTLHELGRDADAALSVALASGGRPATTASLYLCIGKLDAARKTLIDALADQDSRSDAILFVQRVEDRPVQSAYGRKMHARANALRSDPALLAEVSKFGRVLPYTLSEGAPPEEK